MKKLNRKHHGSLDIVLSKRVFMDNDGIMYTWRRLVHYNYIYGGLDMDDLHKLKTLKVSQSVVPFMGVYIVRTK